MMRGCLVIFFNSSKASGKQIVEYQSVFTVSRSTRATIATASVLRKTQTVDYCFASDSYKYIQASSSVTILYTLAEAPRLNFCRFLCTNSHNPFFWGSTKLCGIQRLQSLFSAKRSCKIVCVLLLTMSQDASISQYVICRSVTSFLVQHWCLPEQQQEEDVHEIRDTNTFTLKFCKPA